MNLQQLEYIVAVDTHRHFVKAAESCHVTQPTLSMMIQKLEEELGITIFDRGRVPVIPTEPGREVILRARKILREVNSIREDVASIKGEIKGEVRIGIIPTVAPFLLPLFLKRVIQKNPLLKVKISELTTDQIIDKLGQNNLDIGIAATPIGLNSLAEYPLYKEEFVVYASSGEKILNKKYLIAEDIDVNHLWLLEEGHCLRSQIVNLCELRKRDSSISNLDYEAGSIDSLIKMVDLNEGITILPELCLSHLSKKQKSCIRQFKQPVPVREISLITHKHFVKDRILNLFKEEIRSGVQGVLSNKKKQEIIHI